MTVEKFTGKMGENEEVGRFCSGRDISVVNEEEQKNVQVGCLLAGLIRPMGSSAVPPKQTTLRACLVF